MCRRLCRNVLTVIGIALIMFGAGVPFALAQQGSQGSVAVTVFDPSGRVVPGAELELRNLSTNDTRKAVTQNQGTYNFVGLPIGTYELTVSRNGFRTGKYQSVLVQAARVTDLSAKLKVGGANETVEVTAAATPVMQKSSSDISTTINIKQIEDLPLGGRDLSQLAQLTPGYNGTWNGLPQNAEGNNIDGVIGSPTRMKFYGNAAPIVSPRLEDIQEMTVSTDQLNVNQGFGQANMQVNFVTRSGTNRFHGRVFEDFRNSALNANSWYNNAAGLPKNHLILNEFGGSLGGPIIKDKLFFFGSYSESKQPGSVNASNLVMTQAAQNGMYTYKGTDGQMHTVNVLDTAHNYNSSLPGTVNPVIASELQAINGTTSAGVLSALQDPNLQKLDWLVPAPTTYYYPTVRIDYNMSQKVRMNLAWNQTKNDQPAGALPIFPGSSFADTGAANRFSSYTAAYGLEWTISPTLINEFRGGFLYNNQKWSYNAKPTWDTSPAIAWNFYNAGYPYGGNMSGQQFNLPVSTYYPVFNLSDTMTWQHGAHTMSYGFSWYREQDHYWNPPEGYPNYSLGLVNGDPALQAFTNSGSNPSLPYATSAGLAEAQQLYAILAGRISNVGGQFAYVPSSGNYPQKVGAYNLDELQKAWGLFFQDSYRLRPNLTLNYGLRWDFTGDNFDLTGAYHGASPSAIFGPSGINNLFNPGSLKGDMNPQLVASSHQYNPWNVSPQPQVGIAWSPAFDNGLLRKLTGGSGNSVIRAGFSLRRFTEPQQYFWDNASDYGAFFYQNFYLNSNTTGQPGTFMPGSLSLGDKLPSYGLDPQSYVQSAPESAYTFLYNVGVNGINPHIQQPYTMSWNFGLQRQLGNSRALEVRYVGSRTVHQWISVNPNEVNIFENGFLKQFQAAQANLKINQQNGITSFADNGFSGQQPVPIFMAAFAGEGPGGNGVPLADFANTNFISMLQTGQAGAFAQVLSGIGGPVPYFCNLVGSAFTPCATNAGFSGPGAGYPINFFQANPYAAGSSIGYMEAAGYSTYNGLQIDFRQQTWHGLEFDANYTWSHTLGANAPDAGFNWTAYFPQYTMRNLRLNYAPTSFDLRHVIHVNATYDLPFGRGRQFLDRGGVLNALAGGWTIGTIFTFQTGAPFAINGGNYTYNDYADGGITLNGVSTAQLQSAVGVYHVPGSTFVDLINPKYLASAQGGGSNTSLIASNTVPGTIGQIIYLHGPHQWFDDMAITKRVPIHEGLNFVLQGEFLNAFNHPNFGSQWYTSNVQNSGFGTGAVTNSPRTIELRANIEF